MESHEEAALRETTRAAMEVQLRRQRREDVAEWLFRRAADAFFGWNAGPRRPFAGGVVVFEAAESLGHEEAAWLLGVLRARGGVRRGVAKAEVRQWFLALGPEPRALFVAGGLSLEDDAARAFELFAQSARLGYAKAMNRLGFCYNLGQGCPPDPVLGARWFARAAALGHAGAQFNLGVLHSVGQGLEQDLERACMWYRRAAEQGHADAQFNLGNAYAAGQGACENQEEALRWFERAAEQGHALGQLMAGVFAQEGRGGAPRDPAAAEAWLRRAAEQDCVPALYQLGCMLAESGREEEGERLLLRAATATPPLPAAQHTLGVLARRQGRWKRAAEWLAAAAEAGDAAAMCVLGGMAAAGEGVPQNSARAVSLFERAARGGSAAGAYRLGVCLLLGSGRSCQPAAGRRWLVRAAERGYAPAALHLARCHRRGEGGPPDEPAAAHWLGRAARAGSEAAAEELRVLVLSARHPRTLFRLGEALRSLPEAGAWPPEERAAAAAAEELFRRACRAARAAVLCWMGLVRFRGIAHRDLARPVAQLLWASRCHADEWLR